MRNKNEPLVDEVELIDSNPTYANIRHTNGRESTVSVRDLAPCPEGQVVRPSVTEEPSIVHPACTKVPDGEVSPAPVLQEEVGVVDPPSPGSMNKDATVPELRRSSRISKPPVRYGWD